ncbi:MAG: 3-deoxy-7-phosphoheptulonate synthase [Planctomycetota bacterium]
MSAISTENVNVLGFAPLRSPAELSKAVPASDEVRRQVLESRTEIARVLSGEDDRLLAIVGPCSVHDVAAAGEFAERLAALAAELKERVRVVMRVYFEKPRTTTGWKGLINDPFLYSDREFDMDTGLRIARELLLKVAEHGLPAATEFLDPFTPQYLDDLVSWAAIGARTTESQTHRQMASGLSMPVGFKNATTGDVQVALDAMKAAGGRHHFLGIDDDGRAAIVRTRGNPTSHVILRGGNKRSNFAAEDVADAAERLRSAGLPPRLMVDCSHANSHKKHEQQEVAFRSVVEQRQAGDSPVIGVMIEANLNAGRQNLPDDPASRADLRYGVSVTDACVAFDELAAMLRSVG